MRRAAVAAVIALCASACLSSANLSGAPAGDDTDASTCTADLQTDVGNCGACGKVCANQANAFGVCRDGQCAIGCNSGFADCDGKAETGCEADLARNNEQCGACGRSCGGSACENGLCLPVLAASRPGVFTSITTDDEFLYVGYDPSPGSTDTSKSITRYSRDGQDFVDVVLDLSRAPLAIATDATSLYFMKFSTSDDPPNGALVAAPKTGGVPSDLVAGQHVGCEYAYPSSSTGTYCSGTEAYGIGREGEFLYWMTRSYNPPGPSTPRVDGAMRRCRAASCAGSVADVAGGVRGVRSFAVEPITAFFTTEGESSGGTTTGRGVFSALSAGGAAAGTPLKSAPQKPLYDRIATDEKHIFVSSTGLIARIDKPDSNYTILATTRGRVRAMASDGTRLHWIEESSVGALVSCAIASCSTTLQELPLRAVPSGLTLATDGVYVVANSGGNGLLFKVAR